MYNSSGGHGLGVNWVDINNDKWDDLFVVGGQPGFTPKLFVNNGDGTFEDLSHLLPNLPNVEMSGSRVADYDNDGDKDIYIYTDHPDFYVLRVNEPDGPPNLLLTNMLNDNSNGELSFIENAAAVGLDDLPEVAFGQLVGYRSKTAAWFDYDRDGCIDLFVGHLVHNAGGYVVNQDKIYKNNCNATFSDFSARAGLYSGGNDEERRAALAAGAFHLNDDLWPDLYVVNVTGLDSFPYHNDQIYMNSLVNNERSFVEYSNQSPGLGNDSQAGMGIDVADIDHDGNWDIYISDIYATTLDELPFGNVLYMGAGAGVFGDNIAQQAGVQAFDSWGVNFFDVNNDTWEDLLVATIATTETDYLFLNDGNNDNGSISFTAQPNAAGIQAASARGSAISDFDQDGDLDVAIVNQGGDLMLFRNDSADIGNWLIVELASFMSNKDAIGTVLELQIGDKVLKRQVKGGSSAHSQDSLKVHFGLGALSNISTLKVFWPSGKITELTNISTNKYILISEQEDQLFADGFE